MSMDPADKRTAPRLPIALEVSYPSGEALRRDYISNLSSGGMFVKTRSPLPIGTEVTLEIAVGDEAPLSLRGKVVWDRLFAQGGEPEGFGVRFIEPVDPRLQALLTRDSGH